MLLHETCAAFVKHQWTKGCLYSWLLRCVCMCVGPGLMPSGSGTLRRLAWCHNLTSIRPVMPASISTDRANGRVQTSHSGISRARFLARNRSCSLSGTGHTGCLGCFNPWGEKLTEAISVNRKHSELLGDCERVKKRSVGTINTSFYIQKQYGVNTILTQQDTDKLVKDSLWILQWRRIPPPPFDKVLIWLVHCITSNRLNYFL